MVKENIVENACLANNMHKLKIGTKPTWMSKDNIEGIEFDGYKAIGFKNDSGERVYTDDLSDVIKNLLSSLNSIPNEDEAPKEDKAIVPKDTKELPEFLTKMNLAEWEKLTTRDRMLIFQYTPKSQIFQKPVGNGQTANYVKGHYMIKEANAAFLFDWRFNQIGINVGTEGVCVYGTLEANIDGKIYSRPAVGYEEVNKKMTPQLAIKSATTDAIKKGLSLFGFNSDVYSGDV